MEQDAGAGRAWTTLWTAVSGTVLLRLVVLVMVGLTPDGSLLLVPISRTGPDLAPPLTVVVLGFVAWVPEQVFRGSRDQAFRLAPQLRPLRSVGRRALGLHVTQVLLVLSVLSFVLASTRDQPGLELGSLSVELAVLVAVVRLRRRGGPGGPPGTVVPYTTVPPELGTTRLAAVRDTLVGLPDGSPPPDVVVGRLVGRPASACTTRVAGRWMIVVAPELLAVLDDAQLRALLGHQAGHTLRPLWRRQLQVIALVFIAGFGGTGLSYLLWYPLQSWLWPGWADAADAYATPLFLALTAALGYLLLRVLWPVLLHAQRADEAAADRAMVRLTGDVDACASLLDAHARHLGLPRHWTTGQRLLVATRPAVEDRLDLVRAQSSRPLASRPSWRS